MKINFRFIFSFIVFVAALFSLGSGKGFLSDPIIPGYDFPFGTLIAWIGIIAIPLTIRFGSRSLSKPKNKSDKLFKILLKLAVYLAVFWGLISYFLADNWSFNFANIERFRGSTLAFEYFKITTLIIVLYPILIGVVFAGKKAFVSIKKHKTKEKV